MNPTCREVKGLRIHKVGRFRVGVPGFREHPCLECPRDQGACESRMHTGPGFPRVPDALEHPTQPAPKCRRGPCANGPPARQGPRCTTSRVNMGSRRTLGTGAPWTRVCLVMGFTRKSGSPGTLVHPVKTWLVQIVDFRWQLFLYIKKRTSDSENPVCQESHHGNARPQRSYHRLDYSISRRS